MGNNFKYEFYSHKRFWVSSYFRLFIVENHRKLIYMTHYHPKTHIFLQGITTRYLGVCYSGVERHYMFL